MKNFDFPYINDSPVDLSGIEGYERESEAVNRLHVTKYCDRCGEPFNNADGHGECFDWTLIESATSEQK